MDPSNKNYISCNDVEVSAYNVCQKLEHASVESCFSIIPILRGGMVPAAYIANQFNIKKIFPIQCSTYDGEHQITTEPDIIFPYDWKNLGRKILIVDDIIDTGVTLSNVYSIIKQNCIESATILTAVLYIKYHPSFEFLFSYSKLSYGGVCKQNEWLVFPWEKKENGLE